MLPPLQPGRSDLPEFNQTEFNRFRGLLLEKCGMFFDENKVTVMRNVIQERMQNLGIKDYTAYYRLLTERVPTRPLPNQAQQPPTGQRMLSDELRRLVEGLAVNETAFFRNREHYRALQEDVLPLLFRRHQKDKTLRIWSAGCSTGQEPYSLAMAILEGLRRHGHNRPDWKIEIVASDISEKALKVAYYGRYRSDEMRGLNEEQIKRYFHPLSSHAVSTAPLDPNEIYRPGHSMAPRHRLRVAYEVSPEIRSLISFNFFNLVTPTYPPEIFHDFDLVLCENVTIYFTPDVTRQVIDNIYEAMGDGGFLFIGYSETLWQVSDRFKLINTQDTFYYQKPYPNEDFKKGGGYVRRRPSTGPLSPNVVPPRPEENSTDKLRERTTPPPTDYKSRFSTDPLMPTPPAQPPALPKIGKLPVIGGNRPARVVTGPLKPTAGDQDIKIEEKPATPRKAASNWAALLSQGQQFMREHEFDQALTTLEAAQQAAPNEVDVLNALAELKLKLGDYVAATELCQRAISLNKLSEPAHLMLAMIYHKEGKIEEAIEEYQKTIYVNMDSVIAYMRLADIFRDTGRQRDALREYRRALTVLQQKAPDEMIEDLSVGLLRHACEQNILRLSPHRSR